MRYLLNHLKNYKGLLALALFLAVINQVFSLLDPQIFRLIIDNYATKVGDYSLKEFISGVGLLLLGAIGVALVSRIAKNFQDYYVNVITQKIGTKMYSNAVKHTLNLPFSVFEDRQSGEVLQKMQKARQDTQKVITSMINTLFFGVIGILFVIVYAMTVHWSIGVAYVLLIPILGVTVSILSKNIKQAQKDIVKETAALAGSTTETLRNVELVKSLGLQNQEVERLNKTNDNILDLELTKVKLIRKMSFKQGTLINALRSALLLLMLWLIFQGHISMGEFFSLYVYSFFIFNPLSQLGEVASQYQEAKASNEQLDEILKLKPEKKTKNPKTIGKLGEIKFENINFKYPSGKEYSLQNINVSLKSGKTVAFVGPSGGGKSTIVKILSGLYRPTSGTIFLNNLKAEDINYDEVRNRIGLVSQDTQLFAGTIRDNLKFVNPKASDKECFNAIKLAAAMPILERGGRGLNTKIGEGGLKISGGERQRVAIARALLRNPDIIIFDEATSALDSLTEKKITTTIKEIIQARPNCIIILIAHRLSTIMHSDEIHVLENGKIVESGLHKSLLDEKGLYAALWRQQTSN